MTRRVAAVVRCADLVRHIYATLASLEQQEEASGEIVIVTDDATPEAARSWLARLAADRGLALAHASGTAPGSVRNTGIRATQSPFIVCLDAGDRLNRSFNATLAERLESNTSLDVVTSSIQVLGPGGRQQVVTPPGVDLDALIASTDAIHDASMFRRTAWVALQGFDEALPVLDAYEFWLRLLVAGRGSALVDRPLLVRALREDAMYRRAWDPARHVAALKAVLEKHAALFARNPAAVLYAKEARIQTLAQIYQDAVTRRDAGVRELDSLRARATQLRYSIPADEQHTVDFGDLRRTSPVARDWGYERGTPIDRYYIERFLDEHAADIQGAVLEIQEPDYTNRFGGSRVAKSDVLDLDSTNPRATVISDLRSANNVQSNTYDCVILTQTVHVIDDMPAALSECARILKPGGVLLATLPSASRVCLEYGHDGDFWRVTEAGARHLFSTAFPPDALDVQAHGNVLVNAAFLYGLGCHELSAADFEPVDPYFPLLVSVRAQKPGGGANRAARRSPRGTGAAVLLYHRVADSTPDTHGLCVPRAAFRAQMAHLRDRYHPMPLGDLVAAARENRVPAGAIAVTFDDGYADNYRDASPVLDEYGVPATFFVTTDRLGQDGEFWWDALERSLLSPVSPVPSEIRIDLPGGSRVFTLGSAEERRTAHSEIYSAIAGARGDVRDSVIDAIVRACGGGAPRPAEQRRMTPDEIVSMASRHGHTIGAHTARHVMLPRQPADVQRHEIESSRLALETLLGRPVREFAYPYGAYDTDVVDQVRAASFAIAVTCDESPLVPLTDPLRVPRLEVTPSRSANFTGWLAGQLVHQ